MRVLVLLLLLPGALLAQDVTWEEIEEELRKRDRRLESLEKQIAAMREKESSEEGETHFKLLDLSLNIMTAAGTSTSDNRELRGLQLGNHDPRRRGFTLQQAEFAFAGALVPWFAGEAYVVATDEMVELEEAFLRSLFLSWFEVKAGYYFTHFGRFNRLHPHEWRWADQPVVNGRILGAEHMRGLGGQLAFMPPLPWDTRIILGVQNADDASMTSFLGQGHEHGEEEDHDHEEGTVGGWPRIDRHTQNLSDLLYSARWDHGFVFGTAELQFGFSGALGPNATGLTGRTWLGGADVLLAYTGQGWFAQLEAEWVYRYFQANRGEHEHEGDIEILDPTVLHDHGAWVELYAGVDAFRFGLRLEYAQGYRATEDLPRRDDPLRDDRYRVSPLVGWQPIDMVHVSLQYNFDHTQHIGGQTSHSVWLTLRVMFGVHKHVK